MIDDHGDISCAGCMAVWVGVGLVGLTALGFAGQAGMIDARLMQDLSLWVRDVMMPALAFAVTATLALVLMVLGITVLAATGASAIRRTLRAVENMAAGLALRLEDTGKKKRDETTPNAARLAEPEPDTNIAYYEDAQSTQKLER